MKLDRVSIKNFRSIKHLEFTFPKSGILALVGSNNAGKSNIIRAIDAVCGDQWFGRDKLETHDHYLRNTSHGIRIQLSFDNRRRAIFDSEADYGKWPWLEDDHGHRIRESSPKEAFPCIYLGADRTFDKHMSFYDWTLVGKIRRAFNRRAKPVEG